MAKDDSPKFKTQSTGIIPGQFAGLTREEFERVSQNRKSVGVPANPQIHFTVNQTEQTRAQNNYLGKIAAWLAVEPWLDFGEAAPYIKRLAEIEWDRQPRERDELIRIICSDYSGTAKKLGLSRLRVDGKQARSSHTEDNARTSKNVGKKIEALLPRSWEELRKRGSISQKEAAGYLRRAPKTVQRLVKAQRLKQSAKKRIICDEHLRNEIRNVHGRHVLP